MTNRYLGMGLSVVCFLSTTAGEVMPAWREIGDDASANQLILRGAGQPPVKYGDLSRKGSVELPVDGPRPRVQWDFKLPCDLTKALGVEFDFRCDNCSCLKDAAFYFKSGNGWYSSSGLMPETDGVWQHVKILRTQARGVEGKPAGWEKIDGIRIALQRGDDCVVTTAGVADFALIPTVGNESVVVVRGEWASRQKGAETAAILRYASTFSGELSQIGVPNSLVSDSALTDEKLRNVKILVLPYNPSLPKQAQAVIESFVARGGRLFVCYSLPAGVGKLLGVKSVGWRRVAVNDLAPICGILRTGAGLDGQPTFAPQHSNNTVVPALTGEGEIVACWADREHRSLGVPALVRTPTGLFMSHVWQPDRQGSKMALLKSIFSTLSPELKSGFASADAARARLDEEVRAFVKSVPGKKGERRLAWCHSARGLSGRSWDESVRFLKESGFTDLIANLCWADCAYYQSDVLPVDASVAQAGDAFVQCLAACRKYGVKCHVWKVCYNTGGKISKERVAQFESEGRLVKMFEAKAKNPWSTTFCPSHPANVEREIRSMEEIADKGADGVHFDYIRYADMNFCFCDGCRARFERDCGVTVANWPADVRQDDGLAKKWTDWRCSNITRVVKAVAESLRAKHPNVEISVAARASIDGAYVGDGQDWVGWAKKGWVDFLCPMDYTPGTLFFRRAYLDQQKAIAGTHAKLYPGIGLSCWRDDGTDARRMTNHIRALRQDGLEGFTVFNFDSRAERTFPILATGPTKSE